MSTEEMVEWYKELCDEGYSYDDIARATDTSVRTVVTTFRG